jgi:hypothetical protein
MAAAKTKLIKTVSFIKKSKKKRPGVVSKKCSSKNKKSKHYKKPYRGQGK